MTPSPDTLQIATAAGADSASRRPSAGSPLWRRGFRPFFLGAGLYGALAVATWMAIWHGGLPPPGRLVPMWWHGHEMLFGLAGAAIAGFLLTASPVWTGRPALVGRPLRALAALWAAGRVAMLSAAALPAPLAAAIDLAFLPALALVLTRTLWRTGQWHNYGVVGVVALLGLANAAFHAPLVGASPELTPRALRFALDAVVVLIVVIGGRITPLFTGRWLLRRGIAAAVHAPPALGALAVGLVVLWAVADLVAPRSVASGGVALAAGMALLGRMAGWQSVRTWRDPLVWSLHAGMAWVAIGLLLVGLADLGGPVAASAGLHALTAGAMGSMILAVMLRVSLGHTGRDLALPRGAAGCLLLVHAGAAARVAAAFVAVDGFGVLLVGGALLWAGAFGLFCVLYGPILTAPRVDGKDG